MPPADAAELISSSEEFLAQLKAFPILLATNIACESSICSSHESSKFCVRSPAALHQSGPKLDAARELKTKAYHAILERNELAGGISDAK
jgi:hypothetical protein